MDDLSTHTCFIAGPVAPVGMDPASIWLTPRLLGTLRLPPMINPTPTTADHMAWAICATVQPDRDEDGERPCRVPCSTCRAGAAAVVRAVADQVVPIQKPWNRTSDASDAKHAVRLDMLAKAAELEVPNA